MSDQYAFEFTELVTPDYAPKLTIDERWALWKAANPWVLPFVENLAANLIAKGHRRIGVKQLWEVLRYSYDANTVGSAFRANNDFTSRAARDLIERHPEWADFIEIRALRERVAA